MKFDCSVHFPNTVLLGIHFYSLDKWDGCWKLPNRMIALNIVFIKHLNNSYMGISPGVAVTCRFVANQPVLVESTNTLTNS